MTDAPIELLLSSLSFAITAYFWFIQSRRERPRMSMYQVSGFRAVCRRHQRDENRKRLCVQQLDSCGVLIANNSTRQNSIVMFHCWLLLPSGEQIEGDWGSVGDDSPPWNIGPESSISMGLACFFDVPSDFTIPESYQIGISFITASGKRFRHTFAHELPANASSIEYARAA